jgi:hypothetical protein
MHKTGETLNVFMQTWQNLIVGVFPPKFFPIKGVKEISA